MQLDSIIKCWLWFSMTEQKIVSFLHSRMYDKKGAYRKKFPAEEFSQLNLWAARTARTSTLPLNFNDNFSRIAGRWGNMLMLRSVVNLISSLFKLLFWFAIYIRKYLLNLLVNLPSYEILWLIHVACLLKLLLLHLRCLLRFYFSGLHPI